MRSLHELEDLLRTQPTSLQQAAAKAIATEELNERLRQFLILMRSIGVKKITISNDVVRLEPDHAIPHRSDFEILFGLWSVRTPRGFVDLTDEANKRNVWLLYGSSRVYAPLNGVYEL